MHLSSTHVAKSLLSAGKAAFNFSSIMQTSMAVVYLVM